MSRQKQDFKRHTWDRTAIKVKMSPRQEAQLLKINNAILVRKVIREINAKKFKALPPAEQDHREEIAEKRYVCRVGNKEANIHKKPVSLASVGGKMYRYKVIPLCDTRSQKSIARAVKNASEFSIIAGKDALVCRQYAEALAKDCHVGSGEHYAVINDDGAHIWNTLKGEM